MSPAAKGRAADGGVAVAPRPLPISELDLSVVGRVRAGTCEEAVEDYAGRLEELPPVRVALVDGRPVVVGGLHRVRAHERAGRSEVACTVEPMGRAEAVRAAVSDNRAHGLRMSRADKRAAIRLLLAEAPDTSDRAIAALVGCSPTTVGEVRARVSEPGASSEPEGQVSKLDTWPEQPDRQVSDLDTPAQGATPAAPCARAATRKGRDGKAYRAKARASREPKATAGPRSPAAPRAADAARDRQALAPQPDPPPVDSPALLMDFRRGVRWVARFLGAVLRSPAREHRADALEELGATLTAGELRGLAAWAEAAAASAVTRQGAAGP